MGVCLCCLQSDHLFHHRDYISAILHIFHFSMHIEYINVSNETTTSFMTGIKAFYYISKKL